MSFKKAKVNTSDSSNGRKQSIDRGHIATPTYPLPGGSLRPYLEAHGGEEQFLKDVQLRAEALKRSIDTCTLLCSMDYIFRKIPLRDNQTYCRIMEKNTFPIRSQSLRVQDDSGQTVMVYIGNDENPVTATSHVSYFILSCHRAHVIL